jgi:hypothetical protein
MRRTEKMCGALISPQHICLRHTSRLHPEEFVWVQYRLG